MPVDGSGNFTRAYSWIADKNGGVKIIASRMDGEFDNYANALNQVFWRSGLVSMTGNLPMGSNTILGLGSGSAGTPAIRFAADTSSGLYSPDVGKVALTAGGVKRIEANATGAEVTGALGVSGAATVGGTLSVASANIVGGLDVDGVSTLASASLSGTLSVAGTLTASGNVSVVGTATISNTLLLSNNGFVFTNDGSQDTGMRWVSDGVFAARSNGVDAVTFGGGSSISTAGNAIIGGNATVAGTLGSTGNFTASAVSYLRGTVFLGTTGHGNLGSDTTTTYIRGNNTAIQNGAASATYAYFSSDGRLGIGTTAPGRILDIVASDNWLRQANGSRAYLTGVGTGTSWKVYDESAGADRIEVNTSGNVGIGTAPTTNRLQVAGAVGATNYFAGTQLTSDGGTFGFTNGNGPGVVVWGSASAGAGKIDINVGGSTRLAIGTSGSITSSDLADAVGYKGLPQNQRVAAYTLTLSDMGKHVYTTAAAFAVTIPANSTTAFPIGTAITVINEDAVKTIAPAGGVTLVQAGTGATGTRTLAIGALATLIKVGTDRWYISGAGVT